MNVCYPIMLLKLPLINFKGRAAGVEGGWRSHGSHQGWGLVLVSSPRGCVCGGAWSGRWRRPLRETCVCTALRLNAAWQLMAAAQLLAFMKAGRRRGSPIPPTVARPWRRPTLWAHGSPSTGPGSAPGRCNISPGNYITNVVWNEIEGCFSWKPGALRGHSCFFFFFLRGASGGHGFLRGAASCVCAAFKVSCTCQ